MGDIRTSARVTLRTFKHICSLPRIHRPKGDERAPDWYYMETLYRESPYENKMSQFFADHHVTLNIKFYCLVITQACMPHYSGATEVSSKVYSRR